MPPSPGAEAGSIVVTPENVIEVAAEPVEKLVDTTGAGDLYAAGFLYGVATERDLTACGRLAGLAAAEIISHIGARPETSLADLARTKGLIGVVTARNFPRTRSTSPSFLRKQESNHSPPNKDDRLALEPLADHCSGHVSRRQRQ